MSAITDFHGEFNFLSNFYPSNIETHGGRIYPTLEHAFAASKTLNEDERAAINSANSPGLAKRLGRKVTLRPDWNDIRIQVMRELLAIKFSSYPLSVKLLATGDRELIEGNVWQDFFWGCVKDKNGKWIGENNLGKLLMELRAKLDNDY